tara:strand:- start:1020 stop:1307 length:288 start_codon:yes stop_codon:yes gene_type:complete
MNKFIPTYSESLLLSLTKEIEFIKNRSKNINNSLKNCQNKILSTRLKSELNILNCSKKKIINISETLFKHKNNNLSFEFMLEITKRSNSFSTNLN